MKYWEAKDRGIVFLSLHHGDDVLECLNRLVEEAGLQNAVVMTGLGGLSKGRFHIIASNNYPPGDTFIELDGPLEVAQIAGIIAGGEPHLHLTFLDQEQKTWGGHLEPGCRLGEYPILFENRRAGASKVNAREAVRSIGMIVWLGLRNFFGLERRK